MSDFDDMSRAIGNIEGRLAGIETTQENHTSELRCIKKLITNQRIKVAGIAGAVAVLVTVLIRALM